ncbi:MAG: hypothetical protein AAB442_01510 [Patescibacteria group bacterium]
MKGVLKIILLIIIIAVVSYGLHFLARARTVYIGQVSIEPISLTDVDAALKAKYIYHTVNADFIEVYPTGPGWGPRSFTLTKDTLKAAEDIPGIPSREKFKAAVRHKLEYVGVNVTIKENTWEIKIRYPVTSMY